MDRRERIDDSVESTISAFEGKLAEVWTALPGLIESFDALAMTASIQPAIKGQMMDERGYKSSVNLPLLVDVPIIFPSGGGFTLTYPIKNGDECLVIFSSRCIDGWWQAGGIGATPDERMHDLSDGFAIVGPRSQPKRLEPVVDTENVQLRSDDGEAHITMMPDYTIRALNPNCSATLEPDGTITSKNSTTSITQTLAGEVALTASAKITLDAPLIELKTSALTMAGGDGSMATANIKGNIIQEGSHKTTGDQIANTISQIHHTHDGCTKDSTGTPK